MIYLYVKQHSVTGLKYFGKTTSNNPFSYNGSGKYWLNHTKFHGKEFIETLDVYGFDDQDLCSEFALKFSKDNNIVESKEWANLKLENGLDGTPKGTIFSEEHKAKLSRPLTEEHKNKLSKSLLGQCKSQAHKDSLSASCSGKKLSNETKDKIRKANIGKIFSEEHKANFIKARTGMKYKKLA